MRPRRSCAAYQFPSTFMEHCLLPPPCANLFLQHLGSSTITAKFAQHSAFFIPADFLFLLAHFFFFFPCPHSVFFFSQLLFAEELCQPGRSSRAGDATRGSEPAVSSSGMWGCAQRGRATGGLRGARSEYLGRVSAGCGISESGSSPRRGVSASGLSPSGGSLRTCVLLGWE